MYLADRFNGEKNEKRRFKKISDISNIWCCKCNGGFQTREYIQSCLNLYFKGDYGMIKKYQDDVDANNRELESGYGRILARYASNFDLEEDIYIITYFDKDAPIDDIDRCNTTILYVSEY